MKVNRRLFVSMSRDRCKRLGEHLYRQGIIGLVSSSGTTPMYWIVEFAGGLNDYYKAVHETDIWRLQEEIEENDNLKRTQKDKV